MSSEINTPLGKYAKPVLTKANIDIYNKGHKWVKQLRMCFLKESTMLKMVCTLYDPTCRCLQFLVGIGPNILGLHIYFTWITYKSKSIKILTKKYIYFKVDCDD